MHFEVECGKPRKNSKVLFTFGGTLLKPKTINKISISTIQTDSKWTRLPFEEFTSEQTNTATLSDYFDIKRGLATGHNKFFILAKEQIENMGLPIRCFKPILPSPRYLSESMINSDKKGLPKINKKLFLLDTSLSEDKIKQKYPNLWKYLDKGKEQEVPSRYLCKNRSPWYSQESRPSSIFYCTYIGRGRNGNKKPFRFILNHSQALVTNSYLVLYPKRELINYLSSVSNAADKIWEALNSLSAADLINNGRVYGGGMHKIEPRELGKVNADNIRSILAKNLG